MSAAATAASTAITAAAKYAAACASSSTVSSPRFRTWPITAVHSLEPELQKMGLQVPASKIDGTSSSSSSTTAAALSDALVSVGAAGRGGTGSFVSSEGLILTNWHVAYDAVRQASLKGSNDYLTNGFVSKCREDELGGLKLECWITVECQDVSDQIVPIIESEQDPLQRANRVRDIMQEIAETAQKDDKKNGNGNGDGDGTRCDVQEMLPNESYVLFTYKRLRDVRIVYVPPKCLGNFGGDTDNFEWPRHTADFTVLRAYVGPDGVTPADYDPEHNVPYRPQSFLKVQKDGVTEGDFVFMLGFPGSTMRYAPTSRLRYSDQVAVPSMVKDFARKLELIAKYEKDSSQAALLLGTSKKGLANEFKRSKGKLVMMRKLGLLEEREQDESNLCTFEPATKTSLDRLADIYNELASKEVTSSALESCRGVYRGSSLLATGHSLQEYINIEMSKPDSEREASYRKRNLSFLAQRLSKRLTEVYIPHEAELIADAIQSLTGTPELEELGKQVRKVFNVPSSSSSSTTNDRNLESLQEDTKQSILMTFVDAETLQSALQPSSDGSLTEIQNSIRSDKFVQVAAILWNTYKENRDRTKALLSERDTLFASLLEAQRKYSDGKEVMYPDCNGSLRLSAGFTEGYQPADAMCATPQTTIAGLIDKAVEANLSGDEARKTEFECPEKLMTMAKTSPSVEKVPVCLLYSTDSVGGNSGSPVLNCNGEFVGINFDRQRHGLMNEFKWSHSYSRSIGTDIRFILWLMGDYDGATNLVQEMIG